jgi:hypothetical protein
VHSESGMGRRAAPAAAFIAVLVLISCSVSTAADSEVSFLPSATPAKFTNVRAFTVVSHARSCPHLQCSDQLFPMLMLIHAPCERFAGHQSEELDDVGREDHLHGALQECAVLPAALADICHRQQCVNHKIPVLG